MVDEEFSKIFEFIENYQLEGHPRLCPGAEINAWYSGQIYVLSKLKEILSGKEFEDARPEAHGLPQEVLGGDEWESVGT